MRVLELFSGIGGMHFALKESGVPASVTAAIDINSSANSVYRHNFPTTCLLCRNIQSITVEEMNNISPDILLMSPPCQPFTRVGLKKDTEDNRSCAFLCLLELLPRVNDSLKYILVENVKGFDTSNARGKLIEFLDKNHFTYQEFLLSPTQFGISNSRTRYYLIAKKKPSKFSFSTSSNIITELSDIGLKANEDTCFPISTILAVEDDFDCQLYKELLVPVQTLAKRIKVMDIVTKEDSRSCCFTKAYGNYIEGTGSIYSPFPLHHVNKIATRENYSSDEQFLEALQTLKLRFFSPIEIARLMSFPDGGFSFPTDCTLKKKYKFLGNSINVKVVAFLINLMILES